MSLRISLQADVANLDILLNLTGTNEIALITGNISLKPDGFYKAIKI